jgi:hypothetical protein
VHVPYHKEFIVQAQAVHERVMFLGQTLSRLSATNLPGNGVVDHALGGSVLGSSQRPRTGPSNHSHGDQIGSVSLAAMAGL